MSEKIHQSRDIPKLEAESNVEKATSLYEQAARLRQELVTVMCSLNPDMTPIEAMKWLREDGDDLELSNQIINGIIDEKNRLLKEANDLLGPEGSEERRLNKFSGQELVKVLRRKREIEAQKQRLLAGDPSTKGSDLETLQTLKYRLEVQNKPTDYINARIKELEDELRRLDEELEQLRYSSPEAFYAFGREEMRKYHEQFVEGRIVETPYVKSQAEDMACHLKAGIPVLIHGHLGSGKTELAEHVAKNYLGKKALIISGSGHTSLAELYGHQVLKIGSIDEKQIGELVEHVECEYEKWLEEHKDELDRLSEPERLQRQNHAHDVILQSYLAQRGSGTVSKFSFGPVYEAMAEGRPLIIDEVNAIPHDILISLNYIITRRVGESVPVQQDSSGSEVTVADGFCVIMTGNLEKHATRYVNRKELDAAFLSRLYVMEHDYLPQTTEGSLKAAAREHAPNELFMIMIARLVDSRSRLKLPDGSPEKLWNLAKAARLLQDVFSGKQIDSAKFVQGQDAIPGSEILEKSVLSIRTLENILKAWRSSGKYELDHYLYSEFVSGIVDPMERAYVFQILRDQFDFFKGDGWPTDDELDYGQNGELTNFDIVDPLRASAAERFYSSKEVLEMIFGPAPERQEYPEEIAEEKLSSQYADLLAKVEGLRKRREALNERKSTSPS
jgi:MoxR-like ATPase